MMHGPLNVKYLQMYLDSQVVSTKNIEECE
jgi:hypothetical protein